jgi:hypothetical protein
LYVPGAGDLNNLSVTLQLNTNPEFPCTEVVSDQMLLTLNIPQIIDDQVVDQEIIINNILELTFIVANPDLGNFFWYKDGTLIPGQTTQTLLINNMNPGDAGTYQCTFSNPCGEISSGEAFVQILEPFTQFINLQQGWQGISSFVNPDQTHIPLLFQPVEEQLVILSDNTGFYWPQQSINTLGPWSEVKGYKIKMADNAVQTFNGFIRYPVEPVIISPGWSYLPVQSRCPVNVEEFWLLYPQIGIIKDMAGTGIFWPAFGINTLEALEPGASYQIYNTAGWPFNIEFPACK